MVIAIPVANGKIIASFTQLNPKCFYIKLMVMDLLNYTTRLDPMALGCRALTSPDLPMP
jgi:hypothetical protein